MGVLDGEVAVVTGAGAGLGLAYARALAAEGAAVVVNDVDADAAHAAVESIVDGGGRAVAEIGAIGSSELAQALVDRAVAEYGRLDILVTNAGILRDAVLWKMTDDDFDDVITVHLRGTFTCVRAAAVRMRAQGPAAGSSASARRRGRSGTSGRPTTRRPRPASSAWCGRGRWNWPERRSP